MLFWKIFLCFQTYGLWKSFNRGLIPLTLDCGLTGAIENPFDLSTLDDFEEEISTPDKWLALSCAAHNLNNCMDKFITKFLPKELAESTTIDFAKEFDVIKKFISSCSHRKNRSNEDCPKSFNDFIYNLKPKEEHKVQIARYKVDDFDKKTENEKDEILDGIARYPAVHKISKIRFRDVLNSLKNLAANKNLLQAMAVRSHEANELLEFGELNFELIEKLIEILSLTRQHLNYHEQANASITLHLQSFIDIIMATLNVKESTNQR